MPHSTSRMIAVLAAGAISSLAFAGTAMAHKGRSWHPHPGSAYAHWAGDHGLKGANAKWNKDADRDGLKNWGEYQAATNPKDRDSDDDGTSDAFEDRDRDGLTNVVEYQLHTNPRHHDDLNEIEQGDIEVKGIVDSFTAPTQSSPGELKVKVAGVLSTMELPAGATVIGGDVLTPGTFVEVEIEIEDGVTLVKAKAEDEDDGDNNNGGATGTTTSGTDTSGRHGGPGGSDDD